MSGAKLAILYGYVPCQLGFCGPVEKKKKIVIKKYLESKNISEKEINKILKEFKGSYPYYCLIARSNKIANPMDEKVVKAYWIGNSLLDKIRAIDFKRMMAKEFLPLGKMPKEKIEILPADALPYHNFHVLFIGSVTGRFKETQEGLDLCRVSWGKVKEIKKDKITVWRRPLVFGKRLTLGKPAVRVISWNRNILPNIKIGDWVSIHWNSAVEKLDEADLKNICRYTTQVLNIVNRPEIKKRDE